MPQGKRRPWLHADNRMLMALWDSVGSVALIAVMMGRSRSSVQTQASRLGLPPREEDRDRHRRRWMDGDDARLDDLIVELTWADGKVPIQEVAGRMGRSVDAIVARLESRYGEESDLLSRLVAPPPPISPEPPPPRLATKGVGQDGTRGGSGKVRQCLKCRKDFWSEGAHNRVCITCKRSDDWDFDI